MKRSLLNIGDKISYIAKTNPKMDNSHMIPLITEIIDISNGFYKTSSMIAFKYKELEKLLVSVNDLSLKDLFFVIYNESKDECNHSIYAKKHLLNKSKYNIDSIKIKNNDFIEIHIPTYGNFNADYFELYLNNNPVDFIDHINMNIYK